MAGTVPSPVRSLVTLAAAVTAAALGAFRPGAASAQTMIGTGGAEGTASGWIGVNLEVTELHGPDGRIDSRLVIRGVVDGSPADEAEIRPGDRILRLNGQPATLEAFSRLALRLRPGDRFRMTLARGGWTQELTLQAEPRPAPELVALPGPMVDRMDSAMQRLDSLRVRITGSREEGTGLPAAGTGAPPILSGVARMVAVGPDSTRTVILYTSGRGPTTWWSGLADGTGDVTVSFMPDGETTSYRFPAPEPEEAERRRREIEAQAAQEEALGLRRIIERAMSGADGDRTAVAEGARAVEASYARASAIPASFRPLTPYIVGRNRVAGAALTPLNPGLASYFDVERGLLVTDVTEGTPAHEAGLVPGDVVVRAGDREVASLVDLRRALARSAPGSLSLRVVRQGRALGVILPR